jgi:hypothetical protein
VRGVPLSVPVSGITDACPNLPPQQPADHQVQIRGEIGLACVRGRGIRAHHKKATARKRLKVPAHELAEPPLDAVSGHRGADRPADDKSYPGRFAGLDSVRPHEQMTHHARPARTDSGPHGQRELRATAHPELGRQDQALSRSRPLCLRAARTARPARVRMRSRKPCVLARRRLFGWNVRLLTGAPGKGLCSRARSIHACGSWVRLRLPSGRPLFARRAPPSRLRLWKAIPFRLLRSPCEAGMPRAQHVDSSVDREP